MQREEAQLHYEPNVVIQRHHELSEAHEAMSSDADILAQEPFDCKGDGLSISLDADVMKRKTRYGREGGR